MQVRKWKARHYRYNPNKPKILRFGPEHNQPHAKECKCGGCNAALRLLARLNPERYRNIPLEEPKFFKGKSLPDHVHRRKMLAYSIGTWRG